MRDSTQWTSFQIPGFNTGLELFHSLDLVGDNLYVVYNVGLQVWNVAGESAEDPERLLIADGWRGDFLDFPSTGENDFFVLDVDAIDPSDPALGVLIAAKRVGSSHSFDIPGASWDLLRGPHLLYHDQCHARR